MKNYGDLGGGVIRLGLRSRQITPSSISIILHKYSASFINCSLTNARGGKFIFSLLTTLTLCFSCVTRAIEEIEDPLESMGMLDLSGQQDQLVKRVQKASREKM